MMHNEKNGYLKEDIHISFEDLSEVLGAIANVNRIIILKSLKDNKKEFSELKEITRLSKTALAHHLEKLITYGLIKNVSRGKYDLTEDGLELFLAIIDTYIGSKRRVELENKMRADHIQNMYLKSKKIFGDSDVHFERLLPMKVASFQAYGLNPEHDAMMKMREWAEPLGLFANPDKHPIYGFNNPNPTANKKEYGYEFWLQVDSDFESEDVKLKAIPEGFYVVTRCVVNDPYIDIPKSWKNLINWVKSKGYEFTDKCGLEKVVSPSFNEEFVLDIYIPLVESSVTNKK